MKYDFELDISVESSLSLILKRMSSKSRVLEFGPANGRMTKYMSENLQCKIWAVELDAEAAKDASPFTEELIVGDIESFEWMTQFKDLRFDYIIFADVLEHLYDPLKVLSAAVKLLAPAGRVLMSLPNIAHNSILLELIEGKFTYKKVGLLDDTHIRFFTKQTLEELVAKAGLNIYYETGFMMQPRFTEFTRDYQRWQRRLRHIPYSEVYQFIFEAGAERGEKVEDFANILSDQFNLIVYVDEGNGYNEELVLRTPNRVLGNNWEYDLESFSAIKSIRIDLMDFDLALNLEGVYLGDEKLDLIHNGVLRNGKIYFFNEDPQIVCSSKSELVPAKLRICLNDIEFLEDPKQELIAVQQEHIEKLKETIQSMGLAFRIHRKVDKIKHRVFSIFRQS